MALNEVNNQPDDKHYVIGCLHDAMADDQTGQALDVGSNQLGGQGWGPEGQVEQPKEASLGIVVDTLRED